MNKKHNDLLKALEGIIGSWRDPIPERFFRTFGEQPFESCDYCQVSLIEPPKRYLINKFYSDSDLRQETALCFDCRENIKGSDSKESMASTRHLFSKVHKMERLELASNTTIDRTEALTESCIICGAAKQDSPIYFEHAYCEGQEIVYYIHPFMICGNCSITIYDSLSEVTKGHRRRFYEQYYGPPPDTNSPQIYEYLFNTINYVR